MRYGTLMLLILATGSTIRADEPKGRGQMAEVVRGNNQFALDLYGRLCRQPGNLFLSPYSISTALAMTYAGARGETAERMARVLHFDLPHEAFASILGSLNKEGAERGFRLSVANRLWGQARYSFRPEFVALTREDYGAELAQADFAQTEQARRQINDWVEGQTQGKIKDLIPPGVLDELTRLVLTNAIYFKGDWARPFDEAATEEAPFHVPAGQEVQVPLMHRRAKFRFREGDGLKALELPYGQGDLAMVVLLPDAVEGLPALEARLTGEALAGWLGSLREQEVEVHLPRFTMTSRFELAEALGAMGMERAFTPGRADFTGISTEDELLISAVIHQAFVDVNEAGTEAAAATAVEIKTMAALIPKQPAVFRADHPFVFLIRDNRSGSILFLGRVTDPKG